MKLLFLLLALTLATAPDLWAETSTANNSRGRTIQRTTTFPNGSSSSSQSTFYGQGNGNYTGTIEHRGSGQSYQVNGTIQRNGKTITNKGTVTNQNGEIGTFDRQRTCADRVCHGVNTYQTPQHKTYTNTYTSSCQNSTCTSDILGPRGKTTTAQTKIDRVTNP